jgi:5'-nucleotidase
MMIPLQNRKVLFENVELESSADEKKLTVIHFNDVYNIDERADEPIGGAARFHTALNCLKQENPSHLVLFSGDALSPSTSKLGLDYRNGNVFIEQFYIFLVSVFAKGRQVIDAMNEFGIHAAAIGNHEFGK